MGGVTTDESNCKAKAERANRSSGFWEVLSHSIEYSILHIGRGLVAQASALIGGILYSTRNK